ELEVVIDPVCTFVMSSVDGGGLPVLLVPLTKPVQPFSMAVPSATAESSKRCRKTLPAFRVDDSVPVREPIWPPLIETPLKFIERKVRARMRTQIRFVCIQVSLEPGLGWVR